MPGGRSEPGEPGEPNELPAHALTQDGKLTASADSLARYLLWTNSRQITVRVPQTDGEVEFELYDAASAEPMPIGTFALGAGRTSGTFSNLSASKNYYLVAIGGETLVVTVTD